MRSSLNRRARGGFSVLGCLGIVALVAILLVIGAAVAGYFMFRSFKPMFDAIMTSQRMGEQFLTAIDDDKFEEARELFTPEAKEVWTLEKLQALKKELNDTVGNYRQAMTVPAQDDELEAVMKSGDFQKLKAISQLPVRVGADYKNGAARYDLTLKKVGEDWRIANIEYRLFPGKHLDLSDGKEGMGDWQEIMGDDQKSIPELKPEEPTSESKHPDAEPTSNSDVPAEEKPAAPAPMP